MSADHEIVIVRRRPALEDEHHGGAWKIAFADFMTAMMAFFLVLWIISATDKSTKTIIAQYFNPVKVEEPARAEKGIHGAEDTNAQTPGRESGAKTTDSSSPDPTEKTGRASSEPQEGASKDGGSAGQSGSEPHDPAKPRQTMSEDELFSDPRASLDKIAGPPDPESRMDTAPSLPSGFSDIGPSADNAYRDPFRPPGADGAASQGSSAADRNATREASREVARAADSKPAAELETSAQEKREAVR